MQNKHDQGFSLIEILVAIVILAAFVVPTCSALVMSNEMNNRTDDLMQAQLAVSSAVEILMAEGIPVGTDLDGSDDYGVSQKEVEVEVETESGKTEEKTEIVSTDRFPYVRINVVPVEGKPWYLVTVTSNDELVEVKTSVRAVPNGGAG